MRYDSKMNCKTFFFQDQVEAGRRGLRGRPTITDDEGPPRLPENVQEHQELLQRPQAHQGIEFKGSQVFIFIFISN